MEFLWDSLMCKCGSMNFTPTVEIRWKKGQGTTTKSAGKYRCVVCNELVDIAQLIFNKEREQRDKQIEALRGEG